MVLGHTAPVAIGIANQIHGFRMPDLGSGFEMPNGGIQVLRDAGALQVRQSDLVMGTGMALSGRALEPGHGLGRVLVLAQAAPVNQAG